MKKQKQDETRRFETVTLGLPPLKMVLVHADTERRNRPAKKVAAPRKSQKELDNLKAVIKLIDHLMETE
ncbi:MAG: hypothetical protein A3J86_00045 [Anaerolinea sp. RIFOXYB12_FULL_60_12]|nr:MAG: hypothetical protein A3J86_00045 [Anaerolinea sp. RIFOXYB12_FULL_60_12]